MSILGLPRRSVLSPATQDHVVLKALNSPLYLPLVLLRKHFNVFASPRTRITGGSRASSNNLPSRPVCLELTDRTDLPTSPGETPRNLTDSARDRFLEGEVGDPPFLLSRPLLLPLLLPPRPRLPSALCCGRWKAEVEGDLEYDRRCLVAFVGDPRPPLLVETPLDRDLDLDRDLPVVESDDDRDLDTVVEPTVLVLDWDCDRERDRVRCRDLDRLCSVCGRRDLLEARLPYLLPLVSVCCGCLLVVGCCLDVESVEVVGVLVVLSVSACPGDPGGVELVTGANISSLLTFTSQCPVELNLLASSANTT